MAPISLPHTHQVLSRLNFLLLLQQQDLSFMELTRIPISVGLLTGQTIIFNDRHHIPQACAPNTGILYKATINQSNGAL